MLLLPTATQKPGGITPLHSTRSDVIRLLGSSNNSNEVRSIYQLDREEIYIVYSGSQFCNRSAIPPETVLLIPITPKRDQYLADLEINRKAFREFGPSDQDPNWKGLIDEEDGMIVRTYKNRIDKIFYFASAKDKGFCPNYYSEPKRFAQITMDFTSGVFDEYYDLTFADEKARLDNFAIYLQKEKPGLKGYIVAYSDSNRAMDAQSRSNRARDYLISLGLDSSRIAIVIGGIREKSRFSFTRCLLRYRLHVH